MLYDYLDEIHVMNLVLLQAPGGIPTSQVYAQLLAIYLYQNDLYV